MDPWAIAFLVVAILLGLVLHEVAHAAVAYGFGDSTAKDLGRLSLNPIRHIDPFGTVILPGLLIVMSALAGGAGMVFGYAKPVPVKTANLRRPRLHSLLVSLAGPMTNVGLALVAGLAVRLLPVSTSPRLVQFLIIWVITNLFVGAFNLLPVPPLDGSELIAASLPDRARQTWYRFAGQYGFVLLFLILVLFPRVTGRLGDVVFRTAASWLLVP